MSLFLYRVSSQIPWLCPTPRSCPLLKDSSVVTPLQHHLALPLLIPSIVPTAGRKLCFWAACISQLLKTISWSPALKLDVAKQKEISFCPISLDHCFPFPVRTFSCYSSGVNFLLLSQITSIQIPN